VGATVFEKKKHLTQKKDPKRGERRLKQSSFFCGFSKRGKRITRGLPSWGRLAGKNLAKKSLTKKRKSSHTYWEKRKKYEWGAGVGVFGGGFVFCSPNGEKRKVTEIGCGGKGSEGEGGV